MNRNKLFIIAAITLGLLNACAEKEHKNGHGHSHAEEGVSTEMKAEGASKDAKTLASKKKKADSLKRVDSLQQVKEHGHVH